MGLGIDFILAFMFTIKKKLNNKIFLNDSTWHRLCGSTSYAPILHMI